MDILDRDVFKVNKFIHEHLTDNHNITVVKHHSLRNSTLMRDNKHVSDMEGTVRLAKNLKFGMRTAFGVQ